MCDCVVAVFLFVIVCVWFVFVCLGFVMYDCLYIYCVTRVCVFDSRVSYVLVVLGGIFRRCVL